ncbi:MAG: Type IIS restriction enzyme Eco57I [Candidatus Heimdallarchaeota archaeon LC_3]|nr:MAG: Type IIS restriction enzyme Eco57I [Candidatus Heimdallarchaeota archaeon LC_3]
MESNHFKLFDSHLLQEEASKISFEEEKIRKIIDNVFSLSEQSITMGKKAGNEENVKIKIVLPLLEFLNFDIAQDLNFEESAFKGSIDIAIRTSRELKTPNVLLEAKYWKKDLDKYRSDDKNRYKSDVQQGLIYSTERGIDWFIITNGYEWRLYKTHISGQVVYNFYEKFTLEDLKDSKTLSLFYIVFSKESFKSKLLGKLFSKTELLKEELNEEIYEILFRCRRILFDNLINKNREIIKDENTLMEVGQKILDRIVFIRFAEDNNLFNKIFLKLFMETWMNLPSGIKERTPLLLFISDLFTNIYEGSTEDEIFAYNGGLFAPDPLVKKLEVDDDILVSIINQVYYYSDGKYIDFSTIPIDILGHIYEQYLGLSLKIKEEGSKIVLKEESTKKIRKKHGIYYTPKYIVHFIIENTILRTLDRNIDYLPKLKVLDPACGSGTFLSSAYDILYDKYLEYNEIVRAKSTPHKLSKFIEQIQGYKAEFDTKILSNNIFGVDLNPESVEISKMSLWFKTAQKNVPLNDLENRIKCGDSIIEDEELSVHAFKWNEEFTEMNEGSNSGFDIIIGNPPYFKIRKSNPLNKTNDFLEIKLAGVNAAAVFINKSLKLLKNGGKLGLIVPKQLAFASAWKKIREKLIDTTKILYLVDCGKAFKNVKLEQIIVILEKNFDNEDNIIQLGKVFEKNIINIGNVMQSLCIENDYMFLQYNRVLDSIFHKIKSQSELLGSVANIRSGTGINYLEKKGVFRDQKMEGDFVVLKGNDIQRYYLRSRQFFNPDNTEISKFKFENPPRRKIVAQRIIAHIRDHIKITACIDEESVITYDTVVKIYPNNEDNIYFLLGMINSKLINYFHYKFIYNNAIRSMDLVPGYAKKTPIFRASDEQKQFITNKVKEIIDVQKLILSFDKNILKILKTYRGKDRITINEYFKGKFSNLMFKDKKRKIKVTEILTEKLNGLLIIKVNEEEFYKIEIPSNNEEEFFRFFLESIDPELFNREKGSLSDVFNSFELDSIIQTENLTYILEKLAKYQLKSDLYSLLSKSEDYLNEMIYDIFSISAKEKMFINQSFL